MPGTAPAFPAASLDDAALAAAIAAGAGQVLRDVRADLGRPHLVGTSAGTGLGAAGDAASQAWIAGALAHARPADAVLSEEAADVGSRTTSDRVWIVDPLDGTREFAERRAVGDRPPEWRDDFAVHVALWERGVPRSDGLAAGAVGLPARGAVLSTAMPDGGRLLPAADVAAILSGRRPLRLAASRSRPPQFVQELAARGHVELVPMGSAGVKVVSVVEGTVDAYVHAGGQYEWDSAAPVAVALAAGLECTRLDGTPLEYNRQDPWLPDLFVCHPAVAAHLRAALAGVGVDIKEGAQP